ncbi:MAG: SUMF1/EgtB/PvdO family nonheme iron enzyme [Alphaproteobacteria bacterium]|nr:SUMF1/EgtB/PvdO family nonheme iron enzyme [Alphaproteobacteria bacterium]MCB9792594.1 SUMF1/EgtB/PvdO family nonheme iron enzyme [Alphaproteobacteria bacterium]
MTTDVETTLAELKDLPARQRIQPLVKLAGALADAIDAGESPVNGEVSAVVDALLHLIRNYGGPARDRMALGEALGRLGDPRLRSPADAEYWATVEMMDGSDLEVGRYPVTIAEWKDFVRAGGYERDELWSAEGLAWRDSGRRHWPELAARSEVAQLVIVNQPVVGVTWYEAEAYANSVGARLPSFAERLQVVRGFEKRPYPWGEPFGSGNANTAEEVLGKPCAVGLFDTDCTPDGVHDLAGNVAEWTADVVDDERVVAPGSWEQPSMASWAKARSLEPPFLRGADLGFRIVKG